MKAHVLQENLKAGLDLAGRAVAGRSTLPVLGNILIQADKAAGLLQLSATDLEIGMVTWIEALVEGDGATTVPARMLIDLVNNFPPERVDLAHDDARMLLNVKCGKYEANLKTIPAEEFPAVPTYAGGGVNIPVEQLQRMIKQTVVAAATDDGRPILQGVKTVLKDGELVMAAADGFRLAVSRSNGLADQEATELIIPARGLAEVNKMIRDEKQVTVLIQPERRQALFHTESADLTSRLIEGIFPDFNQIIPKSFDGRLTVSRAGLLKAMRVAQLFARDTANIIKFEISVSHPLGVSPARLALSAESAELGNNVSELDVTTEGETLPEIAFNGIFFIQALESIDADQVVLETTTAASPGVIRAVGNDGWLHMLMPMHISK